MKQKILITQRKVYQILCHYQLVTNIQMLIYGSSNIKIYIHKSNAFRQKLAR